MDPVGIVGLVVGVVGVLFGWKEYADMKTMERRAEQANNHLGEANIRLAEANNRLHEITERLTTSEEALNLANKQLGEIRDKMMTIAVARFPYNLKALIKLIDTADSELAIVCDFIGYAMYSNVSGFSSYLESLQRAVKRKVKIRLLLYGLDTGRQAISKQLPPSDYINERNSTFCADYFRQWHDSKVCPYSYNEFRDTLLRDEEQLIAKLAGVELRVLDHSLLTFIWIADQTETCIFSFRNDGNDEAGMTFQSNDKQIVADFRRVFDSEWEKASEPLYKGRW
jgi:phosphatidylserine/phosphatidylglycerophosphate/cardiolipin synthase-like enzyme